MVSDHSFMLDEKRQIIVVHNLLILEIESDSTQIDDGHLFFITKKDPYETRITDTIRLQGTTTEISVKEIMTGTGFRKKQELNYVLIVNILLHIRVWVDVFLFKSSFGRIQTQY